jgi:outer membrane protein assembly factor BamB
MVNVDKSCRLGRYISRATVLFFAALPLIASSADWISRFNGAGSYWDEAHDMALGNNCVYVTGFATGADSWNDFATVKYDYSGNQQWVRLYGRKGVNSSATAEAIAVDPAGNVIVTGRSDEYVNSIPERIYTDAATLKYDTNGTLLWERRYRLPGDNSQPQDVTTDASGNAYVAGSTWDGEGFNLMLLKYAPDGTLLWSKTAGEPGQVWDAGYAVAIDPQGNPVVAGYSGTGNISYGYLVKFRSDGELVWERRRISYTNVSSWWRIAINNAGLIYVMGEIAPGGDLHHIWTTQYDSNGTLIWDRDYDGTSSGSNYRGGMALTPSGGVVVTGTSDDFVGYGVQNIVTIKYEPDGTEAWRRFARGGYDQAGAREIAVDTFGNAYVTGWGFNTNENMDFVTLKYRPDGALDWTRLYDAAGRTDIPIRIAVDAYQNVFVLGDSNGGFGTYLDFATIRYDPNRRSRR